MLSSWLIMFVKSFISLLTFCLPVQLSRQKYLKLATVIFDMSISRNLNIKDVKLLYSLINMIVNRLLKHMGPSFFTVKMLIILFLPPQRVALFTKMDTSGGSIVNHIPLCKCIISLIHTLQHCISINTQI